MQTTPTTQAWTARHQEFLGTGMDVAMLVGLIKMKGALIQGAGRYFWLIPAVAFLSALATIMITEKFAGSKKAQDLSRWYAMALTDPYAWHVETDRVVQGAAHTLIDDFSEGVSNSPAAVTAIGETAWFNFWSSDQAQAKWREIGSGL